MLINKTEYNDLTCKTNIIFSHFHLTYPSNSKSVDKATQVVFFFLVN
jgi:hypothetical protein